MLRVYFITNTLVLFLCCTIESSSALSTGISSTAIIPGYCQILGVPNLINVQLNDLELTKFSFSYTIKCNFTRGFSFSYSSSCVRNNRSCIVKNDGSYVGFDMSFNGTLLSPNQQINFAGTQLLTTIITIDKAQQVGTYSDTVTFLVNY